MNRPAVLVFVVLAAMVPRVDAAPSCAAECVRRMTECRATRCAELSRRGCRDQCRAVTGCAAGGPRIGTLASIVTECRSGPAVGGWIGRARLEVRRGDCAPVIIKEYEAPVPVPDPLGLCGLWGQYRQGGNSVAVGAFQRLAVSPAGRSIAFELTDDHIFRPFAPPQPLLQEEGMFLVRAGGTGGRTLGPASRQSRCTIRFGGALPPGSPGFVMPCNAGFRFSPNGELLVFTDRGPGTDGSDAAQLVTLDVRTGERRQVTAFVAASQVADATPFGPSGAFVDDDTIRGVTYDRTSGSILFTVRRDGSDFRTIDLPTISSGSQVVPDFEVTGRPGGALVFRASFPGGANEIVVKDHRHMLQLTNFGRPDTRPLVLSPAGKRIFFQASADPFGRNPRNVCQIFSIDHLGGDLRQLTAFRSSATNPAGCSGWAVPRSCSIEFAFLDTKGTLVFQSSCDPFGANPNGAQLFAIRSSDGSGLRQLTNYRGMQVAPDGTVTAELPGPTYYAERN